MIEMDAEVSLGDFFAILPRYRWGVVPLGKVVFHWLGNLDVAVPGISVDLNVAMNVAGECE
jgi:hypothetical protein